MSTVSEMIAAKTLEKLGFENVKFVNKGYDFTATLNGEDCVIEAKRLSSCHQVKALLKNKFDGKRVFLIGTAEEDFCLFELQDGAPKPKVPVKPQRTFRILATRHYITDNPQTLRLYHLLFGSESRNKS